MNTTPDGGLDPQAAYDARVRAEREAGTVGPDETVQTRPEPEVGTPPAEEMKPAAEETKTNGGAKTGAGRRTTTAR